MLEAALWEDPELNPWEDPDAQPPLVLAFELPATGLGGARWLRRCKRAHPELFSEFEFRGSRYAHLKVQLSLLYTRQLG